jgi:uncharacterized protein (TIGR03546 family)
MLRLVARLIKVLNSETGPPQISLAFSLSMVAGLTPLMSLHNIVVFFLVLVLRVNLSAFLLGWAVFSAAAYALDPVSHLIGLKALRAGALQGLWTYMYNSTVWRLERFHNTIVMGSLILSLALFVPLFIFTNAAVRRYRESFLARLRKTRVAQMLRASRFYGLYNSARGWGRGP